MNEEQVLWSGNSSQVINLGTFIWCGLAALILLLFFWPLVIVPIGFAAWKFFAVKFVSYEVTTQRIRIRRGVLSRKLEEVELYRVRDTAFEEPFIYRMFGTGNIIIRGTDVSAPKIFLRAIPNAEALRERIRECVETTRAQKGVRVAEV